METESKTSTEHKKNGVVLPIEVKTLTLSENISVLDLSHRKITVLDENVKLPPNLQDLNLSHNNLSKIPEAVLKLQNLKQFNVSFNEIQYFDTKPEFLHSIEVLDISNNHLKGPPYWIWANTPKNLTQLDISDNPKLTESFIHGYYEELLQYKTLVKEVRLTNCKLGNHLELLGTFDSAKVLEIGTPDLTRSNANSIENLPGKGLELCCDIQRLNVINTQLYTIDPNIVIYKDLIEINLAQNNLNSVPNEFCNLVNLEVCILSGNSLLYLPEDFVKLRSLQRLYLDSNELCMLPENLAELDELKVLDLYNNCLCEVSKEIEKIPEVDLAQNYFEEPENEEYLVAKERLRLNTGQRNDGRKPEIEKHESMYSSNSTEDDELIEYLENLPIEDPPDPTNDDSEEDWDSDDYWVPAGCRVAVSPPMHPAWFYLINQKIEQGNFCPMDIHLPPVHEKIIMERKLNPKVWVEVEGQFDDLSEDES